MCPKTERGSPAFLPELVALLSLLGMHHLTSLKIYPTKKKHKELKAQLWSGWQCGYTSGDASAGSGVGTYNHRHWDGRVTPPQWLHGLQLA